MDLNNDLIDDAKAGNAGLERLIAAAWPEAYKIAWSVLRDAGLAEDAAQEACVSMARSLPTLKNPEAFRGWFSQIVVNRAISVARKRPQTQALDTITDHAVHADACASLDLHNALAGLSVMQRSVVILTYYTGLNSAEIATAAGIPRSTVRFHLMLARRALRRALSPDALASIREVPHAL